MSDEIDQSLALLKSFTNTGDPYSKGEIEMEYDLHHNNGVTSLKEKLYLKRDEGNKWAAEVVFDEGPKKDSPNEAAQKLAEYFERMAKVLRESDFDKVNLNA